MKMLTFLVAGALLVPAHSLLAQDQDRTQTQTQTQTQTRQTIRDREIYGYQLMTRQERNEYRTRMRNAKTAEERERIRAEHHEQMQARAEERGVTLPDMPPAGRGPDSGYGGGMGPGSGGMGGAAGGGGPGGR